MLFVLACPKCGCRNLKPSRIQKLSEILLIPFATPYRCRLCDHRELVFRFGVSRGDDEFEPEVIDPPPQPVAAEAAPVAPGTEPGTEPHPETDPKPVTKGEDSTKA